MLMLKTPFYHPREAEIKAHVISGDFECPAKISDDFQIVIAGLLTKSPQKRFGISELRSSDCYSSPYSLEDIERGAVKCPWKRPVCSTISSLLSY